jgi:Flp pilus assembly CpaE family ATPase
VCEDKGVHDQTVAEDYYAAMERVEQRLRIAPLAAQTDEGNDGEPLDDGERQQLLHLEEQLAEPDLSPEVRMELVDRMRQVLTHNTLPQKEEPIEQENGRRPRAPLQPSPASSWVSLA